MPVIRENIRKGFVETQSKVNAWVQNFKKRLDGEDEVPPSEGYQQGYSEAQTYNRPRRSADSGRRSGDRERYDADPQVLGDDFSALELRDAEGELSGILLESPYANSPFFLSSATSSCPSTCESQPFQTCLPFARSSKSVFPGWTSANNE